MSTPDPSSDPSSDPVLVALHQALKCAEYDIKRYDTTARAAEKRAAEYTREAQTYRKLESDAKAKAESYRSAIALLQAEHQHV